MSPEGDLKVSINSSVYHGNIPDWRCRKTPKSKLLGLFLNTSHLKRAIGTYVLIESLWKMVLGASMKAGVTSSVNIYEQMWCKRASVGPIIGGLPNFIAMFPGESVIPWSHFELCQHQRWYLKSLWRLQSMTGSELSTTQPGTQIRSS